MRNVLLICVVTKDKSKKEVIKAINEKQKGQEEEKKVAAKKEIEEEKRLEIHYKKKE